MEEKLHEGIREKLKTCDAQLEQLRTSLARKQLLLARLAHNWTCPSPVPVAVKPAPLCEPVVVPITATDAVFAQRKLLGLGQAPELCASFANVHIDVRRFRDNWVLIVNVDKSADLEIEGLVPVSDGSDAEQVSWKIALVLSSSLRLVFVASRPLPTFCGTEDAARVAVLLRCADDRYLPCGKAELSWRQMFEDQLETVPDTETEFQSLSESERRLAQFVLDGLQMRLPLVVDRHELANQLGSFSGTTWFPRGSLSCRLRVLGQEKEKGESSGDVQVELRASDSRSMAIAARVLLTRPPTFAPGTREVRWLRRRFQRRVAAFFKLLATEVAEFCGEAEAPKLRTLRHASPAQLAAALNDARSQRGPQGRLPRAVRERLREGARAVRAAQDDQL